MFITKSQIFVATFLFGSGYLCGVFFNLIYVFINRIRWKVLRIILQFIPCIFLTIAYFICYFIAKLPNYAIYMPIVFLLGCLVERKTLHIPLAYYIKKLYNIVVKRDKK